MEWLGAVAMKGMYGVETTHPATVIIVVDALKILPDRAIEGNGREEIEDMGLLSRHVSVLCQIRRNFAFHRALHPKPPPPRRQPDLSSGISSHSQSP
jgi:hypothetical protein